VVGWVLVVRSSADAENQKSDFIFAENFGKKFLTIVRQPIDRPYQSLTHKWLWATEAGVSADYIRCYQSAAETSSHEFMRLELANFNSSLGDTIPRAQESDTTCGGEQK
jgi:hypothetical protein